MLPLVDEAVSAAITTVSGDRSGVKETTRGGEKVSLGHAGPVLVCRAAVRRVGRRQGFDHLRSAETFPHPAVGGAGGGGREDTLAGGENAGVTLPPAVMVHIGSCLNLDRVPEPAS